MYDERNGFITDRDTIKNIVGCGDNDVAFNNSFEEWKYNLHLGNEIYISTNALPQRLKPREFFTIHPGDFVLLITKEKLNMPNDIMGFISMRFKYKQKGLINVSGFHVDPGYSGKLIFSAFNAGPKDIVLRESDPVFMIFFQGVNKNCKYTFNGAKFDNIPADMVENIRGMSATLSSNANRLDKIEFYVKVIGGFTIAMMMGLVGVAIRHVWG